MKKIISLLLVALMLLSFSTMAFAKSEADNHAYWKFSCDNKTFNPGQTVDVKVFLKADYVTNTFGAVVSYDKTFYELASTTDKNNVAVASSYADLGSLSVISTQNNTIGSKIYDGKYSTDMQNKYGLLWFSFTFNVNSFPSKTDKVPSFSDFKQIATLKFKVKSGVNPSNVGKIWMDSVFQQTETTSIKKTFVARGTSDAIGDCLVATKFGQTMDFSKASIALPITVSSSDMEVNYKKTAKMPLNVINPSGSDYSVSYSSGNTNIATVDQNGNVRGAKRGSTSVTATVKDSNGFTVSTSCNVTVKYSFGQWLIKIFLFGWIWY